MEIIFIICIYRRSIYKAYMFLIYIYIYDISYIFIPLENISLPKLGGVSSVDTNQNANQGCVSDALQKYSSSRLRQHVVLAVECVNPPCKERQMLPQECQTNVHETMNALVQLCRNSRHILQQHILEVSKLGQVEDPKQHFVKHMGARVT